VVSWWQLLLIANSVTAWIGYRAAKKAHTRGRTGGMNFALAGGAVTWAGCLIAALAGHGVSDALTLAGLSLALGAAVYAAMRRLL
jgi:hypothetical protein